MNDTTKDKDQKRGDELLKRMLKTPPKPKKKDAGLKPDASQSDTEGRHKSSSSVKDRGNAK